MPGQSKASLDASPPMDDSQGIPSMPCEPSDSQELLPHSESLLDETQGEESQAHFTI